MVLEHGFEDGDHRIRGPCGLIPTLCRGGELVEQAAQDVGGEAYPPVLLVLALGILVLAGLLEAFRAVNEGLGDATEGVGSGRAVLDELEQALKVNAATSAGPFALSRHCQRRGGRGSAGPSSTFLGIVVSHGCNGV